MEKRVCVYYFDIEFPAQFSYVVECANESLRMPNSVDSSSPEQMRGRQKQQQWEKSLDSIDFFFVFVVTTQNVVYENVSIYSVETLFITNSFLYDCAKTSADLSAFTWKIPLKIR